MIVLRVFLCLIGTPECVSHDFQPSIHMTKEVCQATAPMAVANIASQIGEGYEIRSFKCVDPSERDA